MTERAFGYNNVKPIECIDFIHSKYRVRWDFQPLPDYSIKGGLSFVEYEFNHKPTIDEIKHVIYEWINEETQHIIVSGFNWKNMSVWLSLENQFNYKVAHDLAIQTNGTNLPVIFKFEDNNNPTYYKFDTIEELSDFYTKAMKFINEQLAIGWVKKDSIDWEDYKLI